MEVFSPTRAGEVKAIDGRCASHRERQNICWMKYPQLKTAAIGPETSKALAALGLKPTLEAKQRTLDGLVATALLAQGARPSENGA
jgi:uroporphyrinogen-III synthase